MRAYLRLPYDPDPGYDAKPARRTAYRTNREVRHTVIRVITAHLRREAAVSWQGLSFDFTGVVFDGGDFHEAQFSSGIMLFAGAEFSGGHVDFRWAVFSGGGIVFDNARFSGGMVDFYGAVFSGGQVRFLNAGISDGEVSFDRAKFSGGQVRFPGTRFSGGQVSFADAVFSGGQVDFSRVSDWSRPPTFPWTDTPPSGVTLPEKEDESQKWGFILGLAARPPTAPPPTSWLCSGPRGLERRPGRRAVQRPGLQTPEVRTL